MQISVMKVCEPKVEHYEGVGNVKFSDTGPCKCNLRAGGCKFSIKDVTKIYMYGSMF